MVIEVAQAYKERPFVCFLVTLLCKQTQRLYVHCVSRVIKAKTLTTMRITSLKSRRG